MPRWFENSSSAFSEIIMHLACILNMLLGSVLFYLNCHYFVAELLFQIGYSSWHKLRASLVNKR